MPKDPLEPIEIEALRKTESVMIKLQREREKKRKHHSHYEDEVPKMNP